MSDTFNMPKDFGELCEQYAFHDIKEIYTNGSELIQTYRVEQWIEMNGIEEALKKQAAKQATSNYTSEWIPCSERLPEEHDTMFAKFKGTDKWSDFMFAKKSDKVNVTVEFDDGSRMTQTLYTIDGEWKRETNIKHKVIAWRPLPEPYKENK